MLTKKQFDILVYLTEHMTEKSQREIANGVKMSLGTVNKIMAELKSLGYVSNSCITAKGVDILENYRVKRAVIIAAGFGSRLVPITLNTPKPLIRVKGKKIIYSLLDAVINAGIDDIYIVRGYLGEQFDQLLHKYPMLKFIENPIYNETNNISSAVCASHLLKNAYMLEADLLIYNPKLITKYQYSSNFLAVPVEKTNDWCVYTENGRIVKMTVGGTNCYRLFGVSYWTEQDGAKLAYHINDVYQSPGGKERYWDQVALKYYKDEYSISVRECTFNDIVEIDTFNELKALDKTYAI